MNARDRQYVSLTHPFTYLFLTTFSTLNSDPNTHAHILISSIPSSAESKLPFILRNRVIFNSGPLNKGFVLALREMWLLKLNSSKHSRVCIFLFTITCNYLLHQFTSMEFTEVTRVSFHYEYASAEVNFSRC